MTLPSVLLSTMLLLTAAFGHAADDAYARLTKARSLRCSFGPGSSADWRKGKPIVENVRFDAVLQFDSIDLKNNSARLIGNAGASDVAVFQSSNGLTFVERTLSGNMTFTTVFPYYAKGSLKFVAVHSRHLLFPDSPLPSQYHGTCEIWE